MTIPAETFLNEDGSHHCTACGACCKSPANAYLIPHLWDEAKGQCIHLGPDNHCTIYDRRPDTCRIAFSAAPPRAQAEACVRLQDLISPHDHIREGALGHFNTYANENQLALEAIGIGHPEWVAVKSEEA